uniref:LOB domain-containing protein n=2 Tax=Oryza TaxID=4527 RepID=A0A0D3EQE1_9ORYZ
MASIVFVSDARAADPVHGAYGVIRNLQQELASVKAEIAAIRQKQQQAQQPPPALEDGH